MVALRSAFLRPGFSHKHTPVLRTEYNVGCSTYGGSGKLTDNIDMRGVLDLVPSTMKKDNTRGKLRNFHP